MIETGSDTIERIHAKIDNPAKKCKMKILDVTKNTKVAIHDKGKNKNISFKRVSNFWIKPEGGEFWPQSSTIPRPNMENPSGLYAAQTDTPAPISYLTSISFERKSKPSQAKPTMEQENPGVESVFYIIDDGSSSYLRPGIRYQAYVEVASNREIR